MSTRHIFIQIVIILIFLIPQQTIRADASLVVNTTADEAGTGTACSLREAITAANADVNYGGCVGSGGYGSDTITFDASVFGTSQTITLTSNLPNITTNMTIAGPGADLLTVSGANLYRPFYITNAATVSLAALTVTQGHADVGGNLYIEGGSVTLSSLIVSYGWAFNGAGILNMGTTLLIQDSLIANNTAHEGAGGILNNNFGMLIVRNTTFSNNASSEMGGGIFNRFGHAFIQDSTFNNNTAMNGGGLAAYDTAIVSNSTFSGNSVGDRGGGIYTHYQLDLINSTLSDNAAPTGGALYFKRTINLFNSILANSTTGGDCVSDQEGTFSAHNSLIEDGGCGVTNSVDGNLTGDPQLSALADNGGPTQTMALMSNSPAINAGNNSYMSEASLNLDFNHDGDTSDTLNTDQRGAARITNSTVDMGAFEYGSSASLSLVVDTPTDSNLTSCTDLPYDCSLRGAINRANIKIGAQLITFDTSVFSTTQTITLTSNLPNITTNMTIVGPGAHLLTVSGAHLYRPFYITSSATVSLSDLAVTQGYALDGGNLYVESGSVTLSRLIVSYGQAWLFSGGGIFNNGTLVVEDSTVSNNSATQAGGGISNIDNGVLFVRNTTFSNNVAGANGGGIFNLRYHVTIQGSTFNNNTALDGGGLASHDLAIVTNSTFSGNTATRKGGGIATYGLMELINSTVSGNSAPSAGGLYVHYNMNVYNSIIANSSGEDCIRDDGTFNVHNSLIEDAGCGVTNGVNGNLTGDPQIQALADNGGSTQTMALMSSSPAINAGDNSHLSAANLNVDFNGDGNTNDILDTDQRGLGYPRIYFATVDMGAFEAPPTDWEGEIVVNYSLTSSVTLTWGGISWATGYEVQISTSDAFDSLECGSTLTTDASELSLTTCSLPAGVHYWRVRAVPSTGTSAWSPVVTIAIAGP